MDEPLHLRVAVIGFRLELAAELLLGVHLEDRRVIRAVILHEKRLIVRDEFREQRDQEERHEDDEAVIAAPVGFERAQPSLIERGKLEPATVRSRCFDPRKNVAGSGEIFNSRVHPLDLPCLEIDTRIDPCVNEVRQKIE